MYDASGISSGELVTIIQVLILQMSWLSDRSILKYRELDIFSTPSLFSCICIMRSTQSYRASSMLFYIRYSRSIKAASANSKLKLGSPANLLCSILSLSSVIYSEFWATFCILNLARCNLFLKITSWWSSVCCRSDTNWPCSQSLFWSFWTYLEFIFNLLYNNKTLD